jgi:hypothetical protein
MKYAVKHTGSKSCKGCCFLKENGECKAYEKVGTELECRNDLGRCVYVEVEK